jgi:hypothetical protein
MTDRTRYAWIVCLTCGNGKYMDPDQCPYCGGSGQVKAELIRVAAGSAARGGPRNTKRTTADAKFSLAVREAANWKCTRCSKDFSDNHGGLQCAHYIKRRYRALRKGYAAHTGSECCLRHSMDNALALCIPCHQLLEGNLALHEEHFRGWFGDDLCDRLQGEKPKSSKIVERREAV